jgi:hypothetical protein
MKRPCILVLMIHITYYFAHPSIQVRAQTPTSPNSAGSEKFGDLPPNPLSRWDMSGVRAEICNEQLIEPSLIAGKVPSGFRLITVRERSQSDSNVAKKLEAHPKSANYGFATLCFVMLDSLEIEGVRANTHGSIAFAFWWASVAATAPFDKRALGGVESVQLASWYPKSVISRTKVLAIGPTAEFTSLEMVTPKPGVWGVRLKMGEGEIRGSFRASGERKQATYPLPAFMTVPFKNADSTYFTVFTFFGHHVQNLEGEWHASGRHALVQAIAETNRSFPMPTILADGWRAHAGIYKVE